MIGDWTFEATAAGIVKIRLEVNLSNPVTTLSEAMQRLATVADVEADAPRPKTHGEPM
jgi:acetolactate synthase regulatory subunit